MAEEIEKIIDDFTHRAFGKVLCGADRKMIDQAISEIRDLLLRELPKEREKSDCKIRNVFEGIRTDTLAEVKEAINKICK